MTVKVRFAPSPTGPLHIGGARSALFNYLFACKQGGIFLVRIEDTDLERSSRESEKDILDALRWLGIDWHEGIEAGGKNGPYRQTERLFIYEEYTQKLLEQGKAYHCYCTEEELEEERERLKAKGETPRYLGRCRNLTPEQKKAFEEAGREPVVRFKVPTEQEIIIEDKVRGKVSFDSERIGDFVIVKSTGIPTYNFAVVIDDATMGITHVIRGEEHLSNTPRQVLLYQALDIPAPEFAHISLILNAEGRKMSKRDGDTAVIDYYNNGYLPEAVDNFIAFMGWSPEGEQEFFTMEELKKEFSLERVSKSPAVFDLNKLKHINSHYIKEASLERLSQLALPFIKKTGIFATDSFSESELNWVSTFLAAVREKISNLNEIQNYVHYFYGTQVDEPDTEAREILKGETVPQVINLFEDKVMAAEDLKPEEAKAILKSITKELKLKGKDVFMPVRISLTGQMHGPDLDRIISLLGKDNIKKRLEETQKYRS